MLSELFKSRVLVADGATGTYLYSLGVPKGHCYDELSLSHPEIVERIHSDYLASGSDIITTNTFGANRYILEKYYDLGAKTIDINISAVRIARKASKKLCFQWTVILFHGAKRSNFPCRNRTRR